MYEDIYETASILIWDTFFASGLQLTVANFTHIRTLEKTWEKI